ncbi:MAG: hypothetical protein ACLRZ9_00095 [Eubacterium sp.]
MIKEYLLERADILNEIIKKNKKKFEHNQIAIVESNNQIKELNDTIDEASQIFSVVAREDNGFKKQEIEELEIQIAAYVSENKDLNKIIESAEKELKVVDQCLKELDKSDINVSRETLKQTLGKEQSENKKIEIINKLKLCKSIATVDEKRVCIEIDNLINMINE